MNRSSAETATGEIGWGVTAASGVLFGCAVCLVEIVEQPLSYANAASLGAFLSSLAPVWAALGLGWAFAARGAEPRCSAAGLIFVWALTACGLTAVSNPFDAAAPIYDRPEQLPNAARVFHVLWMNLFYGGIYLTGYVAARRAVRSRRALARARQAREESAALLEESRLESMRRQLQPRTILTALGALRALYPERPEAADGLIEVLVGFLRPAVRSLARDTATLAGELDLAQRYLTLRAMVARAAPIPGADDQDPPPVCAFPARLLMPLIESLCLAGARLEMKGGWRAENYHVVLSANGVAPDALDPRLRRRIAATSSLWAHAFTSEFCLESNRLSWKLTVPRFGRTSTWR